MYAAQPFQQMPSASKKASKMAYAAQPFQQMPLAYAPKAPASHRGVGHHGPRYPNPAHAVLPCYHQQRDSTPGGRTCTGRPSKAKYTPAERHAQRSANWQRVGRENLIRGACTRAQPNYRSKSGNRKGAISPQGLDALGQRWGFDPAICRVGGSSRGRAVPKATAGKRFYDW